MSRRGRSPVAPLAALLLACLSPLAVAAVAGLATDQAGDEVETADGGVHGRNGDDREMAVRIIDPPGSDAPPTTGGDGGTSSVPTTAAPTTTATTAPPTTPPTTAPPTTQAPTTTTPPPTAAAQVVALANAARASAGCNPLRIDDRLVAAAQDHSDDMAAHDYFSHTSLDGLTFAERIVAAGYPDPGAENIARGQRSAQAVHDSWMESDGHRRNILDCDLTAIGVGLHRETWTWTQDFGA